MALTEKPVVGQECKLYYNSGTHATPTWVEMTKAINVSVSLGKGEADASARYSDWKLSKGSLKELEISFTYRHKQGADTVFDALRGSYLNGTAIQLAVMDAAITETGAQGPRAFCEIMKMDVSQELENTAEIDFAAKPCYHEESSTLIEPDWYEVS